MNVVSDTTPLAIDPTPAAIEGGATPFDAEEFEKVRSLLGGLLRDNDGCVSARMLRKAAEKHAIKDIEGAITRLRVQEPITPGADKLYWRGRSFYTEAAYLKAQEQAVNEAEVAVAAQPPVVEVEMIEAAPKRRENRQEEARLVTYIRDALDGIYASAHGPEADYAFDVHNERPGSDYENVDLLAVHWRTSEFAEIVAVEAKLEFTAKLVQQAANYRRFADRVWIAVPVDSQLSNAAATLREMNPRLFDHVVDLGIGILACRRAKGRSYEVQAVQWPSALNPNRLEREAFIERHRSTLEEAQVVAPRGRQAYPRF